MPLTPIWRISGFLLWSRSVVDSILWHGYDMGCQALSRRFTMFNKSEDGSSSRAGLATAHHKAPVVHAAGVFLCLRNSFEHPHAKYQQARSHLTQQGRTDRGENGFTDSVSSRGVFETHSETAVHGSGEACQRSAGDGCSRRALYRSVAGRREPRQPRMIRFLVANHSEFRAMATPSIPVPYRYRPRGSRYHSDQAFTD